MASMPVLGQNFTCFVNGTEGVNTCSGFIVSFCLSSVNQFGVEINPGDTFSHCFNTQQGFKCEIFLFDTKMQPVNDSYRKLYHQIFSPAALVGAGDFTAWNERGLTPDFLSTDNCEEVLQLIAEECPRGGYGDVGGAFTFTIDPNAGPCGNDPTSSGGS
ncbi:hypothetical protein GYMLUDRAFT_64437 [Collybiopsis luxurians FD-317 M1]|uniref:Glycan binding protein Y3-like domain-containing protein n=1 Tax=Collybiopsis luxurians FD-317 M1 TaxID=944289 RepID=A0A0D0C2R9_9AGAR|nr:hypothetical protein GYMLUDRAFT_64437 [Collybiopsis luxurians FD-317 M1]